jgi:UDP-N-acetylmuramoyl-tripeptide--D-alanyl-D-alanine ligase
MSPTPLDRIAMDCGGERRGSAAGVLVRRVCTDSRATRPGDLFVCLRGPNFDGHEFAVDAVRRGAVAVVAEADPAGNRELTVPVVRVDNARRALGQLAAAHRQRFAIPVVAVAGSNGKTTTKELVAAVLRQRFRTLASVASFNNDVGLPLTLLELDSTHAAAVVEVGTNHPGELAALLRIAGPTHGVLTRLGGEHLEFFGSFDGVVEEEGALAEHLPSDGTLFMAGDCAGTARVRRRARSGVVTVGWAPENDWVCVAASVSDQGTGFEVRAPAPGASGEYAIGLLGRHQVENALLALALGSGLGLSRDELAAGLRACQPAAHRLQLTAAGGVRILDDSYNANADSMRAALLTLRDLDCAGRRIAVLGDMGELGEHAGAAHQETGRLAAQVGVDALYAVGRWASVLAAGARSAGRLDVRECADAAAAAEGLIAGLRPGDLVLVKASRRTRLDVVVELVVRALSATASNGCRARRGERVEPCSIT